MMQRIGIKELKKLLILGTVILKNGTEIAKKVKCFLVQKKMDEFSQIKIWLILIKEISTKV